MNDHMNTDVAYLQKLGVKIDIAAPLLRRCEAQHQEALKHPGVGNGKWRRTLAKAMFKLMQSGAVLSEDPGHIQKILSAFVAMQYADEHVPKMDPWGIARDAEAQYREERESKRVKQEDKGRAVKREG